MSLISHKFDCKIIKLFRFRNKLIELVVCPPRAFIPLHIHRIVDSFFIHIYGRALIQRGLDKKIIRRFTWFEHHKIAHDVYHGATIDNNWFLFLNLEKWHPAVKPSSAAEDISYE